MRVVVPARGLTMVSILGLVLLSSACGASTHVDASGKPIGAAAATAGVTNSSSPTSEVTEKPTVVIPKPADPLAGKYTPVKRNGKVSAPTISAPPGSFTQPIRYTDSTSLQVISIKQGLVSGKGPGVFPGQATTAVVLKLTNGSATPIDLNHVVVTATYGNPKRVAAPVYDLSAADLMGTAAPGASVNATYKFSIPTAQLGDVVMIVDFDGLHVPAMFAGSPR